jgi:hypothetical protein
MCDIDESHAFRRAHCTPRTMCFWTWSQNWHHYNNRLGALRHSFRCGLSFIDDTSTSEWRSSEITLCGAMLSFSTYQGLKTWRESFWCPLQCFSISDIWGMHNSWMKQVNLWDIHHGDPTPLWTCNAQGHIELHIMESPQSKRRWIGAQAEWKQTATIRNHHYKGSFFLMFRDISANGYKLEFPHGTAEKPHGTAWIPAMSSPGAWIARDPSWNTI